MREFSKTLPEKCHGPLVQSNMAREMSQMRMLLWRRRLLTSFVCRRSQHTMALSLREPEKRNRPLGVNLRCVTPPIVGIANSATARARLAKADVIEGSLVLIMPWYLSQGAGYTYEQLKSYRHKQFCHATSSAARAAGKLISGDSILRITITSP